jgi:hypothetical protein
MKIEKIWVVTCPAKDSTLDDICFGVTPFVLHLQFNGGLSVREVVGYYTTEKEAKEVASNLLVEARL